jgi:hypothetical protein
MSDAAAALFERELVRRAVEFRHDHATDRYVIDHEGLTLFVSLENLSRDYARDHDDARVVLFVDSVLSPRVGAKSWEEAQSSVLFCLEPSDYVDRPEIRTAISDRVDRVPVHFDAVRGLISWITPGMLADWRISLAELETAVAYNLAAALTRATIQHKDVDAVRLGFLETQLPFKSALILAPNLKEVVSPVLGWPLHAVMPDRDFLYLWNAQHRDFAGRVGSVVVAEFTKAPYPISTELFEISDNGIKALGAFDTGA